jgi:hypothetical protein
MGGCHGANYCGAGYTAGEVRRLAKRVTDAAQAQRLLAIAAALDGASRSEAAKPAGWTSATAGTPSVITAVRAGELAPGAIHCGR